jgi:hypothetical protein
MFALSTSAISLLQYGREFHDLAPSHNLMDLTIHNLANNKLEVGCCAVIERNECRYCCYVGAAVVSVVVVVFSVIVGVFFSIVVVMAVVAITDGVLGYD